MPASSTAPASGPPTGTARSSRWLARGYDRHHRERPPADVLATLMADPGTCPHVMADGEAIGVGYFHQPIELDDAGAPRNPASFVHFWTVIVGG